MHIERRILIDAAPATVWEVLTDLDDMASRLPGVTSIERISGPRYGVGTRWRETRKMFGTEASEEMEVVAIEPEHSTAISANAHGMSYRTEFHLTSINGGTELVMRFSGEYQHASTLQRVLGVVTAPLGRAATGKAMRGDLSAIAEAALAHAE